MTNQTVKCAKCGAVYQPGNWCTVQDISSGTESPEYRKLGDIPVNQCPICRTENVEPAND